MYIIAEEYDDNGGSILKNGRNGQQGQPALPSVVEVPGIGGPGSRDGFGVEGERAAGSISLLTLRLQNVCLIARGGVGGNGAREGITTTANRPSRKPTRESAHIVEAAVATADQVATASVECSSHSCMTLLALDLKTAVLDMEGRRGGEPADGRWATFLASWVRKSSLGTKDGMGLGAE